MKVKNDHRSDNSIVIPTDPSDDPLKEFEPLTWVKTYFVS